MHIKLKIKTEEDIQAIYPHFVTKLTTYGSEELKVWRFKSLFGTDITDKLKNIYKDFESVPKEVTFNNIFGSFKIPKKVLDWEKNTSDVNIISNGLVRLK
jgi:hypothetical protein